MAPTSPTWSSVLFHSLSFALLLAPTFAVYWATRNQTVRLVTLFIASMTFYAAHHWPSAFLLLTTIAVNYLAGRAQQRSRSLRLLRAIIVFDLSLLFWFKYAGFAADQVVRGAALLGLQVTAPERSSWLPLGISFFTFQVIAYQVDVYRGTIEAERSVLVFAVFKSFFAQLIAGPIVRAKEFLPLLRVPAAFDGGRVAHGLFLFIAGLGLKIGVADVLRQFADQGFTEPTTLATTDAWLFLYAFAFQLFADFWGYSTMARGLGEVFCLELPVNFELPYLASSLQDFWRRWHITLSAWFRDYVYIPLGGNRSHRNRNLILTMTVAGVWHGAGWAFMLWGALHGLWLVLEQRVKRVVTFTLGRVPSTLLVFHGVCLLWVLFRAPNLEVARAYFSRLVLPPYRGHIEVPETLSIWLIGFALVQVPLFRLLERRQFERLPLWAQVLVSWVLLLFVLAYGGQKYDFVYFAF